LIGDEILAAQTLEGDLSAFEELVNRHKNSVFAIVYKMIGQYQEAEDVCQEVFITVYEKLYQFDRNKKFGPWLHRIAVNASISALRKKKKVISLNFDEAYTRPYEPYPQLYMTDPQSMFEKKELKAEINAAIMELPENYRAVIILRYQMDYKNQEVASILGVSKENVEVRVHRARNALRKIVLKKWEERGLKNELPANR